LRTLHSIASSAFSLRNRASSARSIPPNAPLPPSRASVPTHLVTQGALVDTQLPSHPRDRLTRLPDNPHRALPKLLIKPPLCIRHRRFSLRQRLRSTREDPGQVIAVLAILDDTLVWFDVAVVAIRQLRSGGKVGQGESAGSSVDVSASEEADSALIAQAETAATALAKRMQSVPDAEMTASELLTELATEPDGAVLFLDALAENGR